MNKKPFLCLILAVVLLFSGCVTLRLNEQSDTSVGEPSVPLTQPTESAPADSTVYADTSSPVAQEPATLYEPEHITGQTPVTQPTSVQQVDADWSVERAVSHLNAAVNAVKNCTYPFVLTEDIRHTLTVQDVNSEALREQAVAIVDTLNRSSLTEYKVLAGTTGRNGDQVNINDLIAPAGVPFNLNQSEVSAARVSYEGEHVLIVMALHDDTASADQSAPAVHGSKIPFVNLQGQSVDSYTVQSATLQYSAITLAARTDGQGRLLALTVSSQVSGQADIGHGSMVVQTQIGGTLKETRTFAYS